MVDELQPVGLRTEHRERFGVLGAPTRDDIVAGTEAAERVPLRRWVGIARRRTAVHGDDRGSRMGQEQVPRAHGRVVEVRREHHDAFERVGREHTPRDRIDGHHGTLSRRAHP